jgi:predicted nucleotide-binding protein
MTANADQWPDELDDLERDLKRMPGYGHSAHGPPGLTVWRNKLTTLIDEIVGPSSDLATNFANLSWDAGTSSVRRRLEAQGGPVAMWSGPDESAFARAKATSAEIIESLRWQLERRANTAAISSSVTAEGATGGRVFIGHGGSASWRELKDFLYDRLHLDWDEFNRVPSAGVWTSERLASMLDNASMAFLVCTAEDEHGDGTRHARENVIHEVGLFQGRLGAHRAIVVLEDGCAEFSNVHGLGQIRFPKGNISACFEEVRGVVEREGLISSTKRRSS